MTVVIQGGASGSGRITFSSDRFSVTAQYAKGLIVCSARTHSRYEQMLHRRGKWYVPRVARFALFMLLNIGLREWIMFGGVYAFLRWLKHANGATVMPMRIEHIQIIGGIMVLAAMWAHVRFRIAPWHAAEHMAIAAYERSESVEVRDIIKEERVYPKCGTRFVIPLITLPFIAVWIGECIGVGQFVSMVLAWECILRIDEKYGWDNVPVIAQLSRWMQRHIMTSKPSYRELLTAHAAMRRLVAMHEK